MRFEREKVEKILELSFDKTAKLIFQLILEIFASFYRFIIQQGRLEFNSRTF